MICDDSRVMTLNRVERQWAQPLRRMRLPYKCRKAEFPARDCSAHKMPPLRAGSTFFVPA